MTVEEVHAHNRQWKLSNISYEAVAKDESIVAFRAWITKWLELAYDAGYKAAKNGDL